MPAKKTAAKLSLFEQLSAPFHPSQVEFVIQNAFDFNSNGQYGIKAFASPYITKEAAEDRMDQVFGVGNWENDFQMPDPAGRIKYCVRFKDEVTGEWRVRWEGATIDSNATGNFGKTAYEIALSMAEKRTWAKMGIGRYLRRVPALQVETSMNFRPGWSKYSFRSRVKGNKQNPQWVSFYWAEPHLPDWALPEGFTYEAKQVTPQQQPSGPRPGNKTEPVEAGPIFWELVDYYIAGLPPEDSEKIKDTVYNEQVDEETGEVIRTTRKRFSQEYADTIMARLEESYGRLTDDFVPECMLPKQADQPPLDGKKQGKALYGSGRSRKNQGQQ